MKDFKNPNHQRVPETDSAIHGGEFDAPERLRETHASNTEHPMPEQHPDAPKRNAKGHWIGSGNPTGRPSTASKYRGLLLSRVPELIEKAIAMALEGDTAALRLCLDKALPNIKPRSTSQPIDLPGESFKEKLNGLEFLLSAGEITVDEFTALVASLSNGVKLIDADELQRRVEALEERVRGQP